VIEIKFITWDEETDGIAVEHDSREVWQDQARDGWVQYFRHVMPRGVPVVLTQDTRPSELSAAEDDPRPYPDSQDTFGRLRRWLVDNGTDPRITDREEDEDGEPEGESPEVTMTGEALFDLLHSVAERFYWHGVDDVRERHGFR
jgi:hypothetical protein